MTAVDFSAFQSRESAIRIIELEDNWAGVRFPKPMKDQFKKIFPAARWNSYGRYWQVGPRTRQRLLDWATEALEAAEAIDEKTRIEEESRLVGRELEAIKAELSEIREAHEAFKESRSTLAKMKGELERAKAKKIESDEEAAASREAVEKQLAEIVDLDGAKAAAAQMAGAHGGLGSPSREQFNDGKSAIEREDDRLRAAGLRLVAFDFLLAANFNRPDRDHPRFMPENAWLQVYEDENA